MWFCFFAQPYVAKIYSCSGYSSFIVTTISYYIICTFFSLFFTSIDAHLGSLPPIFAVENYATINIVENVSWCIWARTGCTQSSGVLRCIFLILFDVAKLVSKVAAPIYFITNIEWGFPVPHIFANVWNFQTFKLLPVLWM